MNYKKILYIILVYFSFYFLSLAKEINVTFLNPSYKGNPFWDLSHNFMEIVSKSLDINLKTVYSENRIDYMHNLETAIDNSNSSDYLIYIFRAAISYHLLKKAEDKGIYSFIINSEPVRDYKIEIKKHEAELKHWVSHLVPNDEKAGEDLTKILVDEAKKRNFYSSDGKIHIIGINGSRESSPAVKRDLGINKYAKYHSGIVLERSVFAHWERDEAYSKTKFLMRAYPETKVIWSTSDNMAVGIIKALKELNLKPGKDVLLGSIDWSDDGIDILKSGECIVNLGQHFIEGELSLIKIYDHYHGMDIGQKRSSTKLIPLDKSNIKLYLDMINNELLDKVDFKNFTKYNNSKIENYKFSIFDFISK